MLYEAANILFSGYRAVIFEHPVAKYIGLNCITMIIHMLVVVYLILSLTNPSSYATNQSISEVSTYDASAFAADANISEKKLANLFAES